MESNLESGWSTFWGTLTGAGNFDSLLTILTVVGFFIIVWAIIQIIRGGGGMKAGMKQHLGKLIIGLLLATPTLMPLLLRLVDFIINLAIGIFNALPF